MSQKASLREFREIDLLIKGLPRSRSQKNKLFESDCEILKLKSRYLALSTDSISEEISQGLYEDPYTWGWLTVMSSASDLAASGTIPLGLLLATEWKFRTPGRVQKRFFKGVKDALIKAHLPLLGGDSGSASNHCFNATVIGESQKIPLMRKSVKAGDIVAVVGRKKMGAGPAFAMRALFGYPKSAFLEKNYRPTPDPLVTARLRPFLKASIDTSDGFANSLDIISKINGVGFELNYSRELMHPQALKFCERNSIHPLMLWMGDLGDYQSLVFIDPKKLKSAERACKDLIVLGKAVKNSQKFLVQYGYGQDPIALPMRLLAEVKRDLNSIRKVQVKMRAYFG